MVPDPVTSSYDRFADKSFISFETVIINEVWLNWTAITMGAEYNFDGSGLATSLRSGRYYLRLNYLRKSYSPVSDHTLLCLVDGERVNFGELKVNFSRSHGGELTEYALYTEVSRELLSRLASAKLIEARFGGREFVIRPKFGSTLKEFLNQMPLAPPNVNNESVRKLVSKLNSPIANVTDLPSQEVPTFLGNWMVKVTLPNNSTQDWLFDFSESDGTRSGTVTSPSGKEAFGRLTIMGTTFTARNSDVVNGVQTEVVYVGGLINGSIRGNISINQGGKYTLLTFVANRPQ